MASTASRAGTGGEAHADDPRWRAVLARNRRADGTFVYSVSTTGVYCRPSCPSRRANPKHVRFHASADEAERAGFRPCRRCRPNDISPADAHAAAIVDICRLLARAGRVPPLAALAKRAGLSPHHFHRVFKRITGVTPRAYAAAHRAARVRRELERTGQTVTDAFYAAGFGSGGRFYESSPAVLGMTPTRYRAGGAGTEIRFAVGECSLGSILVARSALGICAISLGDDPETLVRELQDRFPNARLVGGDAAFERIVAAVVGLVEEPAAELGLPLDIRGTAFQQRVWEALRKVPAGTTVSYAEIAARLGVPRAARAVARACAANPLAVAIPCHRVVRTDGSPSGYRWGIERKTQLLARESAAS